ncbi:MAG: CDP-alcohol phosphatidyltransferase family protein [Epsilonproteobacteria bacterium]|nr:CDP-alcohol phosphatidyltransferase family protein [Campylobacterota bacterium]
MYQVLYGRKWWLIVANGLTLTRLFLTPIIVFSMYKQQWNRACALFFVAAITDILDGFCAKRFGAQSKFGKLLDPFADKVLLISSFFSFIVWGGQWLALPRWFFALLLCREVIIVSGTCFLLFSKPHLRLQPHVLGKLTTLLQILFIAWLFVHHFYNLHFQALNTVLIGVLSVVAMVSLMVYIRIGVLHYRS